MRSIAVLAVAISTLLSACGTTKPVLHSINSLSSALPGTGSFDGLESRASILPDGRREISIVYSHGIGWTQQKARLAEDFAVSLSEFYGFELSDSQRSSERCPSSLASEEQKNGGLRIHADGGDAVFETDLSGQRLWLTEIGCMDRQVLNPGGEIQFNLYRLFWDDAFYNGIQYPHLGYDDQAIDGRYADAGAAADIDQPEHQRIAALRRKNSAALKDQLITYGMSDAAMYMGAAGDYIRSSLRASICLAASDSREQDRFAVLKDLASTDSPISVSISDACTGEIGPNTNMAFVAESMGSRALFDVLKAERAESTSPIIEDVIAQKPEVYLLANQISLIGLGQLKSTVFEASGSEIESSVPVVQRETAAQLVAFSEVNDFLTYEIIPYIEQIWLRTTRARPDGGSGPVRTRAELLNPSNDNTLRRAMVSDFGFDVIDVRVEFAGPVFGIIQSVADPLDAHTGMNKQDFITQLIVCGANDGTPNGSHGDCKE